jgi:SNF2 family DNA or RNA helicase
LEEEGEPREIMQAFRRTAEAKIHGVAAYVEHLIQSDVKFLLFAHHHVMLDALENKLRELSTSYIRIDGTTPLKKRHALVDIFQCEPSVKVALLSITACGQGLTLTAASTVVFAELYWVVGQMLQAEDRAHRIGQVQMVDVQYCIAEGSVDELVYKSLNKKSRDTTGMLDGEEKCLGAWKRTDATSLEIPRVSLSSGEDKKELCNPKKRGGLREGIDKYFKRSSVCRKNDTG